MIEVARNQYKFETTQFKQLYDITIPLHGNLSADIMAQATQLYQNMMINNITTTDYESICDAIRLARKYHNDLIYELISYAQAQHISSRDDIPVDGYHDIASYEPYISNSHMRDIYVKQLSSDLYKPISRKSYEYIAHIITIIFGKKATYLTVMLFVSMFYTSASWTQTIGLPTNSEAKHVIDILQNLQSQHDYSINCAVTMTFNAMIRQPELYYFGPDTIQAEDPDTIHYTITI